MINVSVAGMGLIAPTVPGLQRGDTVRIDYADFDGTVRVKRMAPTDDPEVTYYGVELVDPARELSDALLGLIPQAHGVSLEDIWNRAT